MERLESTRLLISLLPQTMQGYPKLLAFCESLPDSEKLTLLREMCRSDLYFLLRYALGRKDLEKEWIFQRCREVQTSPNGHIDIWSREHYKDLADETPILTDNRGWTTHGQLVPGDSVFSPSGLPVRVIAVSPRYTDSACYQITFSDGAKVVAGAGHLWRLRRKIKRRIANSNSRRLEFEDYISSTEQMASAGGRLDVGTSSPLKFSHANLPIDPYLLGCWLGDGHSNGAVVTMLWEDAQPMLRTLEANGHTWKAEKSKSRALTYRIDQRDRGICIRGHQKAGNTYRHGCKTCKAQYQRWRKNQGAMDPVVWDGFSNRLDALGLLATTAGVKRGNHKHIPDIYLRSSVEQRMELLRGLMDTDGHCSPRGTATFTNTNEKLARQVYDLAASLALQPHFRACRTKLDCAKSKNGIYYTWQVSFQAHKERNPFKLKRKADRAIAESYYYGNRTVQKIEPIESVPTRCIQVEGGMYVAGRELVPTHNSSIVTFGLTIQDILASHGDNPDPKWEGKEVTVGIFSFNRPAAKLFLAQIKRELEENRDLIALFPDILYENPKRDALKWSEDEGLIVKRNGNPKEPTLSASGLVDGQPTGMHFFIRVYDDVVTLESARSREMIKKTTQAWGLSLALGAEGGISRYVGTFYDDGDTYHDIIERGGAILRKHPATDNGKADGKPVLFTQEYLDSKKKAGIHDFSCQFLCDPIPDDSAYFTMESFQWYDVKPKHLRIYGASDYAVTEGGGDWTELGIAGLDPNDDLYLLDWWSGQTKADVWIEEQLDFVKQYKPVVWASEAGQIRRSVEPFLTRRMRERRDYVSLEWLPTVADKPTMCRSFQARVEQRKVFLPKGKPWAEDLVRQLMRFPKGKVDDKVDVCGLFGRILDKMHSAVVPVEPTLKLVSDSYGMDEEVEDTWKTA